MYAIMHIRWITIKSQIKKTLKTLCTFKITTKLVAFFLAFFIDKAALGVVELLYNANVTFSIFMIIIIMAHIFYSGEKDFFLIYIAQFDSLTKIIYKNQLYSVSNYLPTQ
jgi:hypothetical protein